jgi:hypothetical protein
MLRGGVDLAAQFVVATRLLPARREVSGVRARALAVTGFAASAFAASAFVSGLSSRVAIVVAALAAFAVTGWTYMLDGQDRSYIRGLAVRASARFRVA